MQLTLVIPELIWPETADGVLERAPCPELATLLSRSRRSRRAAQSLEATLADAFGYAHEPPYAALRLLGEPYVGEPQGRDGAIDAGDDCWLCCDPVHLRFHQQHMLLADSGGFALGLDEAQELAGELNRQLPELGHIHVAAADRWYLKLTDPALAEGFATRPLSLVAGRRLEQLLPETSASRALRSRLNAAQMLLHAHPANQRREDTGQLPINSLWLWGAGALRQNRQDGACDIDGVWANSPLPLGLARAAGIARHRLAPDAPTLLENAPPQSHQLVVLDGLNAAVAYENADAYLAALGELDARWFAPLRAALKGGRLRRLHIEAPTAYATLTWESTRAQQWTLWRRMQPIAALARELAHGD